MIPQGHSLNHTHHRLMITIVCLNKEMAVLKAVDSFKVTTSTTINLELLYSSDEPINIQGRNGYNAKMLWGGMDKGIVAVSNVSWDKFGDEEPTSISCCPGILSFLMANLSNYGFDVISEVPHSDSYHNDMDNQSVHAIADF
ncbi:hypothetical protein Tco_1401103 [Tanacetum coccineum]